MARLIPIPRVRGRRATSSTAEDLTDPHDDAGLPPIETATGMVKSTLAAKAASLAVAGCLVAGPAALVVAMAGRSSPVAAGFEHPPVGQHHFAVGTQWRLRHRGRRGWWGRRRHRS